MLVVSNIFWIYVKPQYLGQSNYVVHMSSHTQSCLRSPILEGAVWAVWNLTRLQRTRGAYASFAPTQLGQSHTCCILLLCSVLCCSVLCCSVLCCAVLCCAALFGVCFVRGSVLFGALFGVPLLCYFKLPRPTRGGFRSGHSGVSVHRAGHLAVWRRRHHG